MNLTLEFVIALIFLWVMLMIILAPKLAKTKHFQAYGPLLLVKIVKNRKILDKFANRFPAILFSRASVIIVFISAVVAIILLVYGAYLALFIPPSSVPSLALEIGLPGLNPAIPIGYGIVALAISVIIHEMFHGIVARKHGIKVSSVGILFLIFPMGAFVEPDESEIQKTDPVHRRRLIAAGPGINIVLGMITFLVLALLLMPAATPIHEGTYIQDITLGSPVANHVSPGSELISFGQYSGNAVNNLILSSQLTPGKLYNATFFNGKTTSTYSIPAGLVINSVTPGTPANNSSLAAGQTIVSLDGNPIYNDTTLADLLDATVPGTTVNLVVENFTINSGTPQISLISKNITTMSKYAYYQAYDPAANSAVYKNQSFVGITISYGGMLGYNLSGLQQTLSGRSVFSNPWYGGLGFITLPFLYLYPISGGLASMFTAPFYAPVFWGAVNLVYWLFWFNFLLGVTNALPILIFDGAQFFRDTLLIAGRRERFKYLRSEKNVSRILNVSSAILIALLLWEIIVPRII